MLRRQRRSFGLVLTNGSVDLFCMKELSRSGGVDCAMDLDAWCLFELGR